MEPESRPIEKDKFGTYIVVVLLVVIGIVGQVFIVNFTYKISQFGGRNPGENNNQFGPGMRPDRGPGGGGGGRRMMGGGGEDMF